MFKTLVVLSIIAVFVIPTRLSENPPEEILPDSSYLYATQIQEEPQTPSLASLIGDEYIMPSYDPSSPTEAVIEPEVAIQEIWVSASFENPPKQRFFSCIQFIKEFYIEFKDKQLYYPKYLWKHFEDFGLEKIDIPVVGALVITLDNPYYGHVGIVEVVSENSFSIIEENLKPGQITTRSFDIDDERIIGFLR